MFNKIKTKIVVEGMHCAHCAGRVKAEIEKLDKGISAKVDLSTGEVEISSKQPLDMQKLKSAISDLGYSVK